MADLLIREIEPALKRRIERRARQNRRSLSAETKDLIKKGLATPEPPAKLGTYLFSLLPEKYRGDDLVFDRDDVASPPPSFE